MQKRIAFFIAVATCALPLAAQAQRKSPLADAPAIRKRLELRSTRFEFGAGAGTTLNQDFFHSIFINVKIAFHLNDWFSLSGVGGFAIANVDTGFRDQLVASLPPTMGTLAREPSQSVATGSMNKISQMFGLQLEFTPFTGKYSLFGKVFAHYDFYGFGGLGVLNLVATDSNVPACTDNGTDRQCSVTGFKVGATFGVGIHSFINQFLALNLEVRDMFGPNNASGRDVNGDQKANTADINWGHTFITTLGVVVFLPTTAEISN